MILFINLMLLFFSIFALILGIDFLYKERFTPGKFKLSIFLLSVAASIAVGGYSVMSFCNNLLVAFLCRDVGLLGILLYMFAEIFIVVNDTDYSKKTRKIIYNATGIWLFVDMAIWGLPNNLTFIRYAHYTSYQTANELCHNIHYTMLGILWMFMFLLAIYWGRQKKYMRDKRFVSLVIASNIFALCSTIPSICELSINITAPYFFFSVGILCAYFVFYIAATKYSAFFITINSISTDIFSNIKAGLIVFNADYRLDIINKYAQELLKVTNEHTNKFSDLFILSGDEDEIFEQVNTKRSVELHLTAKHSGKKCLVSISLKSDTIGEPLGYVLVVTDLTQENELIKKAQVANEAKSLFISQISHEIRTPINAIIGMNEMILRECQDEQLLEYAQNVNAASQTLLSLVNDILDFSKIESGKFEIVNGNYCIENIIRECNALAETRANMKKQEFLLSIDPTIPTTLYGDELRINQIITNLLTNALKYTHESGKISLTIKQQPTVVANIINLIVLVEDTGIGIRENDLKELFKTFTRLDMKNNKNIEGTGLGLAITYNLVELMNGKLTVKSVYQEGSTFSVVIPQKVIDETPIGEITLKRMAKKTPASLINFIAPEASVLVVDDSAMNIDVFVGLLRHTKIQIFTAMDGYEALDKIKRYKYDIIFLDHMMPELDGVEVLQRMREIDYCINADTPVVMLTANALMGADEEYISAGFTDYLAKPIIPYMLDDMVIKYLKPDMVEYISSNVSLETVEMSDEKIDSTNDILSKLEKYLDVQSGMEYAALDIDFYCDMINTYLEDEKVERMISQFEAKDWENYRITVHSIKGTSLTIGASKLSEHAKELEYAVKNNTIDYIYDNHQAVLEEYKALLEGLKQILSAGAE